MLNRQKARRYVVAVVKLGRSLGEMLLVGRFKTRSEINRGQASGKNMQQIGRSQASAGGGTVLSSWLS
jgi:hypothetical protein